jgi:ribosome biogenesis GTPase
MNKFDLFTIGLSERFTQEAALYGEDLYLARVSVQYRDIYKVITGYGEIQAEVSGKFMHTAGGADNYPAVGDWVMVDRSDDAAGNAIIHHVLSRESSFVRQAAGNGYERQVVAANIDTVFICMSLNNDYNLRRLERYLSIAWESRAVPVIVLTKSDLCYDLDLKLCAIESVAPGVDILVTSSLTGDGYDHIREYLQPGKTVAFIGSSGVGKSTLINKLMGREVLVTREIRADDRGRHTTTHRQLLVLPGGGIVIDTPGMRELQMAGADLSSSFADIEELAARCRFNDCQHESEPHCAVKQAIAEGVLSSKRLESYRKLQKELTFAERKSTMTLEQAQKQKIIDMMGSLKACKEFQKTNRKNKGNR